MSSFLPTEVPAEISSVNSDANPINPPATSPHRPSTPRDGKEHPCRELFSIQQHRGPAGRGGAGVTGDAVPVTAAGFHARAEEVLPQHHYSASSLNSEEDEKVCPFQLTGQTRFGNGSLQGNRVFIT